MMTVMRIIEAASAMDSLLGKILARMHPKKSPKIIAHYNAADSDARKRAILEAVAIAALDDENLELLTQCVARYRSASKLRHPFAHHRFGWAFEQEDLLLTIDPKNELIYHAAMDELRANPPEPIPLEVAKREGTPESRIDEKFLGSIWVYTREELDSILAEIRHSSQCLSQFWGWLHGGIVPDKRDEVLAQLKHDLQAPAK